MTIFVRENKKNYYFFFQSWKIGQYNKDRFTAVQVSNYNFFSFYILYGNYKNIGCIFFFCYQSKTVWLGMEKVQSEGLREATLPANDSVINIF